MAAYIQRHPLKREIVATHVLNSMVNRVGATYVHRLTEMTGTQPAQVVRAYLMARESFSNVELWKQVEALDNVVADAVQAELLIVEGELTSKAASWFLRSRRLLEPLAQTIARFGPAVAALAQRFAPQAAVSDRARAWVAAGVPTELAARIAAADALIDALDIAEIAEAVQRPPAEVAQVHLQVGQRLGLARLRGQIESLPAGSYWDNRAKSALGDDLSGLQRTLAQQVLGLSGAPLDGLLDLWETANAGTLQRARRLLADLADTKEADLAMLSVALRELRNLA
jgi:glutamate dehydrogenase